MAFYISGKSNNPVLRLFPVSGPEPQTVIKLFMQVVFKQLINPNVMALPAVSSSCYRDFPRVCHLLSLCSHCRVCSACETESENQKRTKVGFFRVHRETKGFSDTLAQF